MTFLPAKTRIWCLEFYEQKLSVFGEFRDLSSGELDESCRRRPLAKSVKDAERACERRIEKVFSELARGDLVPDCQAFPKEMCEVNGMNGGLEEAR